ncbi:MAG TPA: hypothetical protein VMN36_04885 [Verrucomicrobiales bacterium]|nr:hypothetical protein [Verrucomicrobiales bacterium]
MMKRLRTHTYARRLLVSLSFGLFLITVHSGCERKSPLEEAVDETGDAIEDAADEVEDAVEDAVD